MTYSVDVLIQPVTIRFSLYEDVISYHFSAEAEGQLDNMEKLMKVNLEESTFVTSNVGFLPVASVVLIRGEKNIIVDPGNHHLGFYGMLDDALKQRGMTRDDIDMVIVTHWHHDHFSNLSMFRDRTMVIGKGELDTGRAIYGDEEVDAKVGIMKEVIETPQDQSYKLLDGIEIVPTPGHTPHSISVMVEEAGGKTAIIGDLAMVKRNFMEKEHSHWYSAEQTDMSNEGIDLIRSYQPRRIIPGHDREFKLE